MTSVFGRSRLVLGLVGLVSAIVSNASAVPTVSLQAVKVNGSTITRTNNVTVNVGDRITAEFFASDWSPNDERLRAFQLDLKRGSFQTGRRGFVKPVGWDRPIVTDIICPNGSSDCPSEFPQCEQIGVGGGVCVGPNYDPSQGLFMDFDGRADWVFNNPSTGVPLSALTAVDFAGDVIRYGGIIFSANFSLRYSIPPKYCGTVELQVSNDACGTFRLFIPSDATTLTDRFDVLIPGLVKRQLRVNVNSPGANPGECSCRSIVASTFPNCAIDARQSTDPDGNNPQRPDSITLTFDCPDTTDIASVNNFDYSIFPAGFGPSISSVVASGSDVIISLSTPMLERKWNCFTFDPTGVQTCLGIMPGDVNSDGTSNSFTSENDGIFSDIDALVDCLNAPGSCDVLQCDSDRSGSCGPQDLLRTIDLLVGTGLFPIYDGQGILDFGQQPVACPSAP